MAKRKRDLTERQRTWLKHIEAAASSGGTLAAYATANGLEVKQLYQWKTALRRRGLLPDKRRSAFVMVATPTALVSPTSCSITLPNGVRVQIAGELDATKLGQILSAANTLS